MVKVTVTRCKCGMIHIYYDYGRKNSSIKIEPCDKCGDIPKPVTPGEMGKIRVQIVTEMVCPACGERKRLKRGTKSSEAVCKVCGYKNAL